MYDDNIEILGECLKARPYGISAGLSTLDDGDAIVPVDEPRGGRLDLIGGERHDDGSHTRLSEERSNSPEEDRLTGKTQELFALPTHALRHTGRGHHDPDARGPFRLLVVSWRPAHGPSYPPAPGAPSPCCRSLVTESKRV